VNCCMPEVIYCAGGNKKFAAIAMDCGFVYGAQLPGTVYFAPEFVDQNWKSPDLEKYVEAVSSHMPRIATVLDWERWDQLGTAIDWAYAIAPYVREAVVIIPKVKTARSGWQNYIPKSIDGLEVRLGYSVKTKYGGTPIHLTQFLGWPIHLLGGNPLIQARIAGLFRDDNCLVDAPKLNVVSIDGNYHQRMAVRHNRFFIPNGSAQYARNRFWPTLKEFYSQKWGDGSSRADAPYKAFSNSCKTIKAMWVGPEAVKQVLGELEKERLKILSNK